MSQPPNLSHLTLASGLLRAAVPRGKPVQIKHVATKRKSRKGAQRRSLHAAGWSRRSRWRRRWRASQYIQGWGVASGARRAGPKKARARAAAKIGDWDATGAAIAEALKTNQRNIADDPSAAPAG